MAYLPTTYKLSPRPLKDQLPMVEPRRNYQRELHNHAVQQNMVLRYDYIETGLQHDVVWTAVAFLNNFEYGRGQGSDKKTAREEAARRTIIALIAASYNQL